MALIGTNSQGIATSSLAEWVKVVTELSMPEETKKELDTYIDEMYNKVSECKFNTYEFQKPQKYNPE